MNLLGILSDLVSIRSVNDPLRGERPSREAACYISDVLGEWGLEPRLLERDGYYTVYGELGGGRPRLLLLAHYDTVPAEPSEWSTNPFKTVVKDGRIYGRGVADDKGNAASLMLALRRLAEEGVSGVAYAFTGDEEVGGACGAGYVAEMLEREGRLPRYLVNADGHSMAVIVRRRSAFRVGVSVKPRRGKVRCSKILRREFRLSTVHPTRHAAYFLAGADSHPLIAASQFLRVNANYRLLDLRGRFLKSNVLPSSVEVHVCAEESGGEEREIDVNLERLIKAVVPLSRAPIPSLLYSDYGVSVTPNVYTFTGGEHVLQLDVRAFATVDLVERSLRDVLDNCLPEARLEVAGGGKWLYTPLDATIVRAALEVLEEVGERPLVVEGAGASDSRWFSVKGVEALDFGPRGGNVHGVDEYVELDSLLKLPEFYYRLARRLLRRGV
ncbi:MAG: peptidase [Thermoprotei archaeon]|nr:MAG: peptidase [Thermoprotei archaeon]